MKKKKNKTNKLIDGISAVRTTEKQTEKICSTNENQKKNAVSKIVESNAWGILIGIISHSNTN